MKKIKIADRTIGKDEPCFIIAEAGVNHDGDIEKAKHLIDIAKESGADAVKFQTWITENLCMTNTKKAEYQKEHTGEGSQFEMIKKLEISFKDFKALKEYCDKKGIIFMSTPDDRESAEFLVNLGIPAIKIGSGELNNLLYLKFLARFNKPIILSTGTGTLKDVKKAVDTLHETGNLDIVVLHCTTDYPTKLYDVNLRAMLTMKEQFNVLVGYSDHTLSMDVPVIARALGAVVIEKHFTYDKNAFGPDHKASFSPKELTEMVKSIRELDMLSVKKRMEKARQTENFELIMGNAEKIPTERELENLLLIRKSIVAKTDIKAGQKITEDMLIMKRADEGGIPTDKYHEVVGKKAKNKIKKDTLIKQEDIYI